MVFEAAARNRPHTTGASTARKALCSTRKRFPDPLYRYASVFRPTFSCFTAIYGAKARISDLSPAKP